jgi:uncharacterized protein YcfJ
LTTKSGHQFWNAEEIRHNLIIKLPRTCRWLFIPHSGVVAILAPPNEEELHMKKNFLLAAGTAAMLMTATLPAAQAQTSRDRAYCEDVAYNAAWRRGTRSNAGEGAVAGAVTGGVLGAILGKGKTKNIVGGAVAGTAAGAILGSGSRSGYIDRRAYRVAYNNCIDDILDERARPVRVYRDADIDDEDIEYCMSRFRSYNPRTGMYRTYSGQLRPCP